MLVSYLSPSHWPMLRIARQSSNNLRSSRRNSVISNGKRHPLYKPSKNPATTLDCPVSPWAMFKGPRSNSPFSASFMVLLLIDNDTGNVFSEDDLQKKSRT